MRLFLDSSALATASIRTLDALHVASAMEAACSAFLSADRRQCRAAVEMGVSVVDLSSLGIASSAVG